MKRSIQLRHKELRTMHVFPHDGGNGRRIAVTQRRDQRNMAIDVVLAERVPRVVLIALEFQKITQYPVDKPANKGKKRILATLTQNLMKIKLQQQQRSEEHTYELQSLMRISYAVFCLKQKNNITHEQQTLKTDNLRRYTKL